MESFLVSTALAFVIYQIFAYLQPVAIEHFAQYIGRGIGPGADIWLRRGAFAILAILILYLLLAFHHTWPFHIDTSRTRVNIVAGFFCGPLLAIWVNSILNSAADKGLSKGQIVGGCALVALAVIGSLGDDGAKLLRHYSRDISSISVAGAALQFGAGNHRDATPGAPSTPPAGSKGTAVATSQGLQYASNLGVWFIKNDIEYFGLLTPSDPSATNALASSKAFAEAVIEPPLACLFAWQQKGTDPVSVSRHLSGFAEALRYLQVLDDPNDRSKFAQAFAQQTKLLADEAILRPPPSDNPCGKLAGRLSADDVTKQLDALPKGEYDERPYLAIAYAGLLAQLHHYTAATATLANWLDHFSAVQSSTGQTPKWTANDWLEIRARSILAAFSEEWIEGDQADIATPVRNEHLSNLDQLISKLRTSLDNSDLLKPVEAGTPIRLIEPGTCPLSQAEVPRRLFTAYITIDLVYWQNTLLHPAYDEIYVKQASDGLDTLVRTDVSCAKINPQMLYAQILSAYAHNAILYTDAKQRVEDEDERTARLATAQTAAQLGMELAKKAASSDKHTATTYLERIAPNDALDTWEALRTDANYLEKIRGE
jgi:hypothetical protein